MRVNEKPPNPWLLFHHFMSVSIVGWSSSGKLTLKAYLPIATTHDNIVFRQLIDRFVEQFSGNKLKDKPKVASRL